MRPAAAETPNPSVRDAAGCRLALLKTAVSGVYLKTEPFQRLMSAITEGFDGLRARAADLRLRGDAVMAMADLERSAYVDRFPQLVAGVRPLLAGENAPVAETAMTPAACLALYPLVAARGPIGHEGLCIAVTAPCHRNEETYSPTRLRAFTMSERVIFGRAADVRSFVERLQAEADRWLRGLGLSPSERVANDPFYGRGAEVIAQHQRALQSKIELVLPIGELSEVACLSFNLHGEFFTQRWGITLLDGGVAESACVGVGLERLALALVERHGDRLDLWPPDVHRRLFGTLP